jgi:hypothetical protein
MAGTAGENGKNLPFSGKKNHCPKKKHPNWRIQMYINEGWI